MVGRVTCHQLASAREARRSKVAEWSRHPPRILCASSLPGASLGPVYSPSKKFSSIPANLSTHAWNIKCRQKKTNYTVWLKIAKRIF